MCDMSSKIRTQAHKSFYQNLKDECVLIEGVTMGDNFSKQMYGKDQQLQGTFGYSYCCTEWPQLTESNKDLHIFSTHKYVILDHFLLTIIDIV